PLYGSGGFTSYTDDQLVRQFEQWLDSGFTMVKMKVGEHPQDDLRRVEAARSAIGPQACLFVDANGAYTRKQALAFAQRFAEYRVAWFEEPVSSDDLDGLKLLRDRGPPGMDIAAGEYGYELGYFRRMLAADAVDTLQADASRCGGVTGFMRTAALAEAFGIALSSHCAPALHVHLGCATDRLVHAEYFFDHARIEGMLFDGAVAPENGALRPDCSRPGFGIELKRADAARFAV
ncbi:MAG TPA: enolase C-terminal domain-like protein, partial [Rudaea sp.]|nr:enolase C-terminal domain-like protein [Rudaea sp.]